MVSLDGNRAHAADRNRRHIMASKHTAPAMARGPLLDEGEEGDAATVHHCE